MLKGFIILVAVSIFIRILRRKMVEYGGKSAQQFLQAVDAFRAILLFASIALFVAIFFIIFNKRHKIKTNESNQYMRNKQTHHQ